MSSFSVGAFAQANKYRLLTIQYQGTAHKRKLHIMAELNQSMSDSIEADFDMVRASQIS